MHIKFLFFIAALYLCIPSIVGAAEALLERDQRAECKSLLFLTEDLDPTLPPVKKASLIEYLEGTRDFYREELSEFKKDGRPQKSLLLWGPRLKKAQQDYDAELSSLKGQIESYQKRLDVLK